MRWLKVLYEPPLRMMRFFYRLFFANRKRVAELMAKPWVSNFFKNLMVTTLFLWIAIWLFASDERRNKLTGVVKENWSSLKSSFGK